MRIAVVNANQSKIGGTETYINSLIPALVAKGHEVAVCFENKAIGDRQSITIPEGVTTFCFAGEGAAGTLRALRAWAPDVLYVHGLVDWRLEEAVLAIAPAVFYVHSYYGTCISGAKTVQGPILTPCDRRFGPACLLHFYPRRCGGLNPFTMWQQYELQSERLRLLNRYRAVLANSQHMVNEFERHGIRAECLYLFTEGEDADTKIGTQEQSITLGGEGPLRLMYLGRMEQLKGGGILLAALPIAKKKIDRELHVIFAGSGPDKELWENRARLFATENSAITTEFLGWIDAERRCELLSTCHLLLFPSLWPEPFGLGGIEAGMYGLPCVGFDVGGIPEWLTEGVNGCLAAGNPPSARSLADAIVRALRDPVTYLHLRGGALARALNFSKNRHLTRLIELFEQVHRPVRQRG